MVKALGSKQLKPASEKKKQRLTIFKETLKKQLGAAAILEVFGVDVLKCECGSELKPVSAIIKGDEIKRYLRHLGLDADPPELEETETEDKSVTSVCLRQTLMRNRGRRVSSNKS